MRIPALLLTIGLGLSVSAQDPTSFIQVTVTDTALAPTKRIVYSCSVRDRDMDRYDVPIYTGSSSKEQKRLEERMKREQDSLCMNQTSLNAQLLANGYHMLSTPLERRDGYTVRPFTPEECSDAAFVEVGSEEELMRLIAFIRSKGTVNGEVVAWERETEDHEKKAVERMYKDALAQAQDLAAVSGRKLGPMLNAEEETDDTFGALMRMEARRELRGMGEEHRSMKFRFALLP